ncbi:FkbM family methyltransferase [Parvularcula sp. LCG005]|uniref:FkbM family methyltransferase n=1 Tax=Parvularcula sp. LCG005 TaxID=3078805 RepID=UPI002943D0C5|nr:FkbM family methyltransferase [Parvularcula sp. LCG005]WOI53608.1 FkbM family methyltransferase [Parvularcula sp. LCG005]
MDQKNSDIASYVNDAWRAGRWEDIATDDCERVARENEDYNLTLKVIFCYLQSGHEHKAKRLIDFAIELGASTEDIFGIISQAAHLTLAKLGMLLGDSNESIFHLNEYLKLDRISVETEYDAQRWYARLASEMEVLPFEADRIAAEVRAKRNRHPSEPSITILQTQVDLLRHELSIAMQRGQLQTKSPPDRNIESMATSQLGQELWVLEMLKQKESGFFVEFGATDGHLLSNTYILEKLYNWSGILAEPNPVFHSRLAENRSCIVAHDCIGNSTGDTVNFVFADEYGGMADHQDSDRHGEKRRAFSAIKKNRAILQTISLHDFLLKHNAPHNIDYISVDTEGSEFDILKDFPFHLWNIHLWTIEHNYTEMRDEIYDLLTKHGYSRKEAQWDDWYYRN